MIFLPTDQSEPDKHRILQVLDDNCLGIYQVTFHSLFSFSFIYFFFWSFFNSFVSFLVSAFVKFYAPQALHPFI